MWVLIADVYFTPSILQSPDGEETEDVPERRRIYPIVYDPKQSMIRFLKASRDFCPLAYMNENIHQSHEHQSVRVINNSCLEMNLIEPHADGSITVSYGQKDDTLQYAPMIHVWNV